ncbi:MAG: hypothetical protein WCI30_01385 [Clostridia bacterium]
MLKKLIIFILLLLLLFNIYTWAATDAAIIDPNSPVVTAPAPPPDVITVTPETVTPVTTPPAENIPKVDNSPVTQISPDINITVPNSEKKWTVNDIIFGSAFAATLISALLTTFVTLRSRKQDKRMKDTDVLRITLQIGSKKLIAPLTNLNDKLHSTEHLHNMQAGDTSNYYSSIIAQPLIELILDLRTFGGMLALEKAEQIEALSAQLKNSIITLDVLLTEFDNQIIEKEAMREKKISAILDVLFANECLAKYLNIPFI